MIAPTSPPPIPLTPKDRAYYSHWHSVGIRVNDLDDQRHVNNAVFAVYCEEGRRTFLEPVNDVIRTENVMQFIVRLAIDFHLEIGYPGIVNVGSTITRIGNSSYTTTQGLFTDHGCHATIEAVTVVASSQTRRPISIPVAMREYLSARLSINNPEI